MKNQKNILAYLALAAVCIIWGTTYLALRVGVTQFPPFLFSAIRFLIAGPLLILFMMTLGKASLPPRTTIIHQAISGLCMVTLGVGVVGWAEMQVSSGLAAIICSMIPIYIILINLVVTTEDRPTLPLLVGFVVGSAGIIMIFGEHLKEFSEAGYTLSIFAIFLANISWAFGTVWIKKQNQNSNPFMNAGLQMLFGGLFLVPMSLALDDYSTIQWTDNVVFALVYLIVIGSVAAYTCYSYAIKNLPVTLVSLYAYINPIVAVILGWLLLAEKFNLRIGIGILVTIAGIYIVNRGYQLKSMASSSVSSVKSIFRKFIALYFL